MNDGRTSVAFPADASLLARRFGRWCAGIVIAIGGVALIGWFGGPAVLRSGIRESAPMMANTAVAIIFLGVTAMLLDTRRRRARLGGAALAAIVAALAAATIVEYVAKIDLHIDRLLVRDAMLDGGLPAPGRMAFLTAVLLAAIGSAAGCAILGVARRISVLLASAVAAASLFVLLGYVGGIAAFYEYTDHKPTALNTAVALLLVPLALLTCNRVPTWIHIFFLRRSAAGTLARRLTPAVIAVTAVSGWLRFTATNRGILAGDAGLAMLVAVNVTTCLALIVLYADVLRRRERRDGEREAAVRLSDERFRLAVQATEALVYDWDIITGSRWWSDGVQLFGYAAESCSADASWWSDRLHPEDRARIIASVEAAMEGRAERWSGEYRFRCADGSYAVVTERGYVLKDEAGTAIRMIGAIHDITARKRAEAVLHDAKAELEQIVEERTHALKESNEQLLEVARDLRTSNAELEAFSYSVSHDLRAPLRAIDGFSQALLEDNAPQLDESGRKYLDRIRAATHRMGELIDDLLTLSRISRSQMRSQAVNLSEVAREIAARLRQEEPERAVTVEIEEGLSVRGDRRLLEVAMANLMANAWKFTSKTAEARIRVGGARVNGSMRVFVADNGAGFDPRFADKLFTPFQRLHAAADYPGNGVGLATVQRIVHRHGGRISAEGAPAQGATFSFDIPVETSA